MKRITLISNLASHLRCDYERAEKCLSELESVLAKSDAEQDEYEEFMNNFLEKYMNKIIHLNFYKDGSWICKVTGIYNSPNGFMVTGPRIELGTINTQSGESVVLIPDGTDEGVYFDEEYIVFNRVEVIGKLELAEILENKCHWLIEEFIS